MKRFCTGFKFFIMLALMTCFVGVQGQQLIWGGANDPNGEFDGGLNDWLAIGVSAAVPDSAGNALWVWDADGIGNTGSFWGAGRQMQSPSVNNGVALFNSDFLDNGGAGENGIGLGPAPATNPPGPYGTRLGHRGELISPTIDCSGFGSVAVNFNSYKRHLENTNGNTTTYLGVSNDDGQTWTEFEVQPESVVNTSTDPSTQLLFNVSAIAAGSSTVRIKFVFEGYYYFWMVDDVSLTTLPDNDLLIADSSLFFAPGSQYTPQCHIVTDTMGFSGTVSNRGAVAQNDVVLKAEILDQVGTVLYEDSVMIDVLVPTADSAVAIEEQFVPDMLDVGQYFLRYSTFALGTADFNMSDNVSVMPFFVTQATFSKEDGPIPTSLQPGGGGDYAIGNVYVTSPLCTETFYMDTIDFMVGINMANEPLSQYEVEMYILEVESFTGFDLTADFRAGDHPNAPVVGFGIYDFQNQDEGFELLSMSGDRFVDFVTFDTTDVLIKNGYNYLVMVSYTGQNNILFHGVTDSDIFYNAAWQGTILYTTQWFNGGFGSENAAVIRMQLRTTTSVNEVLEDAAINMFPNPTSDVLNVAVDLENAANTTVTLATMNGSVINYEVREKVKNDIFSFNVVNLPAGTYLVKVTTEEGSRIEKFIKQ